MRGPALALALCAAGAAIGAEADQYARVLAAVTLSFDAASGDADRAVLVANDDAGADLYLYRGVDSASPAPAQKPALIKKNAAWSGLMWGTRPTLALTDKQALQIKSENTGVGRNHWSQTLTIAYRDKEFVVAGLTFDSYDTMQEEKPLSCDLNFLSGKGTRNGRAIVVKTRAPKLADWSDDNRPKECAP